MGKLRIAYNSYIAKKEPMSFIHFVTNRCNARCDHCFIDFDHPDAFKGELSLEEIEKLTKSVGKSLFNVNLTGGEPFLRKDLFEIAKLYIENTPIESIYITTNGTFPRLIKKFIEQFLLLDVQTRIIFSISIDNFPEEHDKHRKVKGLFVNAMESYKTITSFNDPRLRVNIGITVTDHNYDQVNPIYVHLKSIGIQACTATIMREEGVVQKMDPLIKAKILEAYKILTKRIHDDQVSGQMEGFGDSLQGTIMNAKNMIMNKAITETYLEPRFIAPCNAGTLFGVIYANGDVYPCEILADKKLGNLREYDMNFMSLWQNSATKETTKFIKDTNCNCTFECAWSINIVSNPQFIGELAKNAAMLQWKKAKFQS